MGELLQEQGWQVLEAENGDAGIELAKLHRPEVVLCDLLMAGGNGFRLRALRSDDDLRQTKIVISSGRHFEKIASLLSRRARRIHHQADRSRPLRSPALPHRGRAGRVAEPPAPVVSLASGPTRVKFWGVRGSIPTPGPTTVQYGGNTSCVEVRADGQIIILDAGTGMRLLGQRLAEEFESQPIDATLLLTHTHWDHIQGLPFFRRSINPRTTCASSASKARVTAWRSCWPARWKAPSSPSACARCRPTSASRNSRR